jgi:ParB family chromosome partitioning protein
MRHEAHYVETLSASSGKPIGRLVPIDRIDPNPEQPRQVMGDLTELKASIVEKGIIEPLIVRPRGERYGIIAGERRYQAAVQLGLTELPVVLRAADESESIELALVENLQRKNLTAFEEAEALQALVEAFAYTHAQLARRLGKSRTSITESLSLTAMPEEVQRLCRLADISSKSVLLEVVRQRSPEAMLALVEQITRDGDATRQRAREAAEHRRGTGRAKPFVYRYAPANRTFSLRLAFRKTDVPRNQLIAALEGILDDLRSSDDPRESGDQKSAPRK